MHQITVKRMRSLVLLAAVVFSFFPSKASAWRGTPPGDLALTDSEKAWLKAHPVIRLAPDPEFQPIEFFDKQGNYSGIGADYARLIEKKLGIRFKVVRCKNWDDVIERIKRRDVDMLNAVVRSPQREAYLTFSKPYLKIPSVIIVRKNVEGPLTLDMLAGMHVVMVSGYGYVDLIRNTYPGINIDLAPDLKAALRKVSFGMADAFVGDLATASYYIEREGIANLRLAGETEPPNISGFAVRNDWPELCGILDKAVATLTEKERQDIFSTWIHLAQEAGLSWSELRNVMLLAVGVLTVFVIWNWTLRRMVNRKTRELQGQIEERKRAEEALARNEALMRTLLKTIPDLVWLKDTEGVYLACNARFERFFGAREEEIVGNTDYDFVDRELADFFREKDAVAIAAGKPMINEETITYADDGHQEQLETIKTPIYSAKGRLIGVLGIARDITERKKAEQERQRLQDQLFQARKMDAVGRLAGGVAHDFNNMLSVIIGRSELAKFNLDPSDPLYEDLDAIETVGRRSADLTRQLLAFARKQTIDPVVLDLNESVGKSLAMLRRLIGEGIELTWEQAPDLWWVSMDPTQVEQLLANLIINACDAMEGQVGQVRIRTGNCVADREMCEGRFDCTPGDYVWLSVSDTGHGMDKDTLENIFEPFFTTKELGKGTGLGLATIYGIIKQNDGFIHVESEPEKGSVFTIYLPRYQGPSTRHRDIPVEPEVLKGTECILLVEDEPEMLKVTRNMLEGLGYRVVPASRPAEALRLMEGTEEAIDLLMTDVVMPEMSGRELAARLSEQFPDLKCLFMSGYTSDIISHHGVLDEGINFIQKPFQMKTLAYTLRTLLDTDE